MSHSIIKSISIIKDSVYITSAPNNVRPLTFERYESEYFTDIYRRGGYEALLKELAIQVWKGNYHLRGNSKICRSLQIGLDVLSGDRNLCGFLDTEHAAQYIADFAYNIITVGKSPFPDITKLQALRHDKSAVIQMCDKNPAAFDYAAEEIRKDRDVAMEHIRNNSHKLLFNMPTYFRDDKELAMLALKGSGPIYRHLSPELQADKEVIRLAFDPNQPRDYFEHLPDLIPESLRNDKAFMKELVTLCPQMHFFRTPELLEDKQIVQAWLETGAWSPDTLKDVPTALLNDPDIQSTIRTSAADKPDTLKKAEAILAERGILPAKPSLDSLLKAAENKTSAAKIKEPAQSQAPSR